MTAAASLVLFLGVGACIAAETGEVRIAVLFGGNGAPFKETLAGFQQVLRTRGMRARYIVRNLAGNGEKAARAVREIKSEKPDLLFTVGTRATEAALKKIADIPIIAGLLLRPDLLDEKDNATGVYLEHPVETQLKWLRRILPEARNVGILFNPGENWEGVKCAARIAADLGLRLEAREVESPGDIPQALESLGRRADVLWGMSDSVASAPETARYVLLSSFRHRIPFVGLSSSWVKAGALYSLEWDYGDIGSQCGEMALKVLGGEPVDSIPPAPPRRTVYALNMNTAKQLNIRLPESIVRGAVRVFQGGD